MNITRYGDAAIRVELDALADVHCFAHALRQRALPGVVDVVPSWATVLVTLDESVAWQDICSQLEGIEPADVSVTAREHVVPVTYDGPDLSRVADHVGLAPEEVVARHVAGTYTVAFLGFVPGFGYLSGLDATLATPRLATPRPTVPAGSVAIADHVSAIYPTLTPGGWNVIGRTTMTLFDPSTDPPARLAPGDLVRFQEV